MKFGAFCTCVFHMSLSHVGNNGEVGQGFPSVSTRFTLSKAFERATRAHIGHAPSAREVKIEN